MAKTSLFKLIKKCIQQAYLKNENPEFFKRLEDIDHEASQGLNRREFISRMTVLAAAIPLSNMVMRSAYAAVLKKHAHVPRRGRPLTVDSKDLKRKPASTTPVTILGGGFAGLTAAHDLSKSRIPVEIFEASSRVGGRVFTQNKFNSDNMFIELGAELIDTGHADLMRLAKDLGLELDDLAAYDYGYEKCQYFFGGKHLFEADLIPAFEPFAAYLAEDIAAVFPPAVQWVVNYKTHSPAAPKFDNISIYDYIYSKTNVARWVLDLINQAYICEYGLETQQQSSINLLFLINPDTRKGFHIFGESDEKYRIKGGNSKVSDALQKVIEKDVPIQLGHELLAIKDNGSSFTLTFKVGSRTIEKTAQRILCTLPPTILRKVKGIQTLGLSPVKLKFINELGFGTNAKMMIGFKSRMWRNQNGKIPRYTGETFNDLKTQSFWETSRAQSGQSGILTNFSGGNFGASLSKGSLPLVLNELDLTLPGLKAQYDGNLSVQKWATNPLVMGSYSCPLLGQYTTIYGAGSEPELGGRFLLAGESCSEMFQGFMNGAVETGLYSANLMRLR